MAEDSPNTVHLRPHHAERIIRYLGHKTDKDQDMYRIFRDALDQDPNAEVIFEADYSDPACQKCPLLTACRENDWQKRLQIDTDVAAGHGWKLGAPYKIRDILSQLEKEAPHRKIFYICGLTQDEFRAWEDDVRASKEASEVHRKNEVMPNNEGRISNIAISLTQNNNPNLIAYLETILELLKAKLDDGDFSVCVIYDDDFSKRAFENMLWRAKIDDQLSVTYIKSDKQLHSIWIRDDGIRKGDNTMMLPRNHRGNGHDLLALNEGSTVEQSDLLFQAGDVRATASCAFIGIDTIYRNVKDERSRAKGKITGEEIAGVVAAFEKQFGKKIIVIGLDLGDDGNYQPIDKVRHIMHTDMIVTPLNDKDVVVAEMPNESELNVIAKQLSDQGFNVTRVPYHEFRLGLSSKGQLTYNNVLLENYGKVKRVYLPQYFKRGVEEKSWHISQNLEQLNQAAVETYLAQGYEVVPIPVPLCLANQRGSLNCLTFEKRI